MSNFWVFWGGVVPFLAHTLLDVTLITHGGDWELWPLNYLFRALGIRLPLGVFPNGSQAEVKAFYLVNGIVALAYDALYDYSPGVGFGVRFVLLTLFIAAIMAAMMYGGAVVLKGRRLSSKLSAGMAMATMIVFILVR